MAQRHLPYRRAGAGNPLVLVHGFLGGAAQWEPEIAHFKTNYDVIAPDLPGFGAASALSGCNRIEDMAVRVVELLDHISVRDFLLLGHSMGGMVVQEMAARLGHRVKKLVLYGTGPLGLMPDRFEPIGLSKSRLQRDGVEKTIERIGATWFVDGNKAWGHDHLVNVGKRANTRAALAALDAMAAWDGRKALSGLDMPTLVVWGDADRSYRWSQVETLWKTLPNATLSVIPGASHAAHLEKPEIFRAVLKDFLSAQ